MGSPLLRSNRGRSARSAGVRIVTRVLVALLVCASLVAFAIALASTWEEAVERGLPTAPVLIGVVVLTCGAVVCGAHAWAVLVGARARRSDLTRSYYVSQLAKYIPGGIWQPAGQIAVTNRAGVPVRRATGLVVLFMVLIATAALPFALFVAIAGETLPAVVRLGLGASVLGLALVRPGVLRAVVAFVGRRVTKAAESVDLPPGGAIDRSSLLLFCHHLVQGLAFAIVLRAFDTDVNWVLAVAAFPVAWLAGFLALPVPSGIGVREAALVGLLHGAAPAEAVLAAGVVHRLANVLAEGIDLGGNQLRSTLRRQRAQGPSSA